MGGTHLFGVLTRLLEWLLEMSKNLYPEYEIDYTKKIPRGQLTPENRSENNTTGSGLTDKHYSLFKFVRVSKFLSLSVKSLSKCFCDVNNYF